VTAQQDITGIQHRENWLRQFRQLSHLLFGCDIGARKSPTRNTPMLIERSGMRPDDRMPRFPRFSMACFTLLLPRSGCDLRSWLSLYERGRTASFGLRSSALVAPRSRSPASQDTLSTSHVGISCRCGWWRIVACRGCAGLHAVSRSIIAFMVRQAKLACSSR
jgi:hypothetical protein